MQHTNEKQKLKEYKVWLEGQSDRLTGQPCKSADGLYLDGWYAPEAIHPDFLTHPEAIKLRAML